MFSRYGRTALIVAICLGSAAKAQEVDFGDDSSEFAQDGECDDRRFFGASMANSIGLQEVGRDATDCKRGYDAGALWLWDPAEARAATDCAAISFGDDASQYAGDGECDDIRFEGIGSGATLLPEDMFRDAADCQRLCTFGLVFLRDYK